MECGNDRACRNIWSDHTPQSRKWSLATDALRHQGARPPGAAPDLCPAASDCRTHRSVRAPGLDLAGPGPCDPPRYSDLSAPVAPAGLQPANHYRDYSDRPAARPDLDGLPRPATPRALALDELYANNRTAAYLHVVDVHSGAVWAAEGPLPADSESWTLVLWSLQDRGLRWDRLVGDHGQALQAACQTVSPQLPFQRDVWHELDRCAHVQARLDRAVTQLSGRTAAVQRQAARVASGQRPRGRRPQADVAAHAAEVAEAQRVAEAVRFLTQELRRLWQVLVIDRRGLLTKAQRQCDLDAVLSLLAEVADTAAPTQQEQIAGLLKTITAALPQLLTFSERLDQVHSDLSALLPAAQQALLGWAWLRRKTLGWDQAALLAAVPEDWRAVGGLLLHSWQDAVRVSSAVERWHSILRPHVAVHRTLSNGMLAVLAVWHNHRVFSRGVNKGKSPLHLSGMTDAPSDWLVALGYPPVAVPTQPRQPAAPALALAA